MDIARKRDSQIGRQTKISVIALIWSLIVWRSGIMGYATQLAMGLSITFCFLSYIIWERLHWTAGLAYLYFSLNAVAHMVFPQYFWGNFQLSEIVGFQALVQESQIYLTIIAISFALMRQDHLQSLKKLLIGFAVVDSVVLSAKFLVGQGPYFLFNNPAIDVSFIACTIPMVYEVAQRNFRRSFAFFLMSLFVAPCIYTKTSSGILGLGAAIAMHLWVKTRFNKKYLAIGCSIAVFLAVLGIVMQGWEVIVNSSGRFDIWKLTMGFWMEHLNRWIGAGQGTFYMYGPGIQVVNATLNPTGETILSGFFWMHNDWLQVIFETGAVGLACAILVYSVALLLAREIPYVFSGLIIYGILAFIQMPLRHFLFTILGGFFVTQAFRAPEKTTSD